jgi:hypothetical protein
MLLQPLRKLIGTSLETQAGVGLCVKLEVPAKLGEDHDIDGGDLVDGDVRIRNEIDISPVCALERLLTGR